MDIQPMTLQGRSVRLVPLTIEHAEALYKAAQSPTPWHLMSSDPSVSLATMQEWINKALRAQEAGTDLPFVIIEQASNEAVGSTRYLNIDRSNRGLEIGFTWLNERVRRSSVNTQCKYLLLTHAFETLGAIRVQLKTDSRNLVSQRAIERLGATKEGMLRNHMILPDNYYRTTVMYSIIDSEWPTVKNDLREKMR